MLMPNPSKQARVIRAVLMMLVFFMNLLCDGCVIGETSILASVTNCARNKGGDDLGKGDDGETDEGVHNGVLGFFGFARVARGSHVLDTTVNKEDYGNDTSDADNPGNGTSDHTASGFHIVASFCRAGGAVAGKVGAEGGADGV